MMGARIARRSHVFEIQEVRELLGEHKQEFVNALLQLLRSEDEAIRLGAIKEGSIGSSGRLPLPWIAR
jgi:hypothetical protein